MKENLLSILENSRGYTLAVAEAMPEKLDSFKPMKDVWTFREQVHHISYGIEWWKDNYVNGNKTSWDPPPIQKNRKETMAYLNKAYNSLEESIRKATINDEIIKGFYATLDHITHHRGQLIVYLRCNGITPPEYTY